MKHGQRRIVCRISGDKILRIVFFDSDRHSQKFIVSKISNPKSALAEHSLNDIAFFQSAAWLQHMNILCFQLFSSFPLLFFFAVMFLLLLFFLLFVLRNLIFPVELFTAERNKHQIGISDSQNLIWRNLFHAEYYLIIEVE